jgi:hypothetical protein
MHADERQRLSKLYQDEDIRAFSPQLSLLSRLSLFTAGCNTDLVWNHIRLRSTRVPIKRGIEGGACRSSFQQQ